MPRSVNHVASRAKRKKTLKLAKGYFGRGKNVWTVAKNKIEKGLGYAYRDRKARKRDFRALWIQRINAATDQRLREIARHRLAQRAVAHDNGFDRCAAYQRLEAAACGFDLRQFRHDYPRRARSGVKFTATAGTRSLGIMVRVRRMDSG